MLPPEPVTVWAVCVGDRYGDQDVHILRAMVARHLSRSHDFWCLSDRKIAGINCVIPDERLPGWWSKIQVFAYARAGQSLYLDLDSVVVGPLDDLLSERLSAPANWGQSGHGGVQSCVMSWGLDYGWIADAFDPGNLRADPSHPFGRYGDSDAWGDQGLLTEWCGDPGAGVIDAMQGVASYRYHCQRGLPDWARVVQFHGKPKPSEVSDEWVRAARSTATRT